uniref:Uncharacterized protein n=1 Tax=Glycine max TaxID=3847 RepID=C6T167_SOYBN|nr:unknown [Glycine max]
MILNLFLRNSNSKNPIFHRSLHFIHFCILRQSEPPHELSTATLHAMPRVVLIFILNVPLSADLKHLIIFNLHLHFLLLQPGNIGLEHVRLWGLLPIHTSAHKRRIFPRKLREGSRDGIWERKILEGIEHIAPTATENVWNERHFLLAEFWNFSYRNCY